MSGNNRRQRAGTGFKGVIAAGKLVIDAVKKTVYFGSNKVCLTPGEYRILEYLALNAGRPVSQREMLECAMCYASAPNTTTVSTRICHLRRKLSMHDAKGRIRTVRGFGYAFDGPTSVSRCLTDK